MTKEEFQELAAGLNFYEVLNRAKGWELTIPPRPQRPSPPGARASASLYAAYAEELAEFEPLLEAWQRERADALHHRALVQEHLRELVEAEAEVGCIPEQYRSRVIALAWDDAHAYGMSEYFNKLNNLVNIFV